MADDDAPAPSGEAVSQEKRAEPPPAAAPVQEEDLRTFCGVRLDAFVKAGTTTAAHDRMVAEQEAEAEQRRDLAARERATAKEFGVEQGDPNSVAAIYTSQFTDHPEIKKADVPLHYMGPGGREVEYEGVGDIVLVDDPKWPGELALLLFCPKCKSRGLPAGQSICTIRQSNRKWDIDRRKAGELFVFDGQPHRSAGVINSDERFTCPRCPWRARIYDNRVMPE